MNEPNADPRDRATTATQEEVEAWAEREHKRRAAWLDGPSEEEKRAWARRYRWRANLGLEESRLPPSREDIDQWAAREHRRRKAWLAGPTDEERESWATRQLRRESPGDAGCSPLPTVEEIDAWATAERQRRQEWLDGPTDDEKRHWAKRRGKGVLDEIMNFPFADDSELPEAAHRLLREAELAGKGSLYALSHAPLRLWSFLLRAGEKFEEEFYQRPPRRRVRY